MKKSAATFAMPCLALCLMTAQAMATDLPLASATDTAKPPIIVPNSATTTQYSPVTGFPDHNGDLSGMLIIIPKAEIAEFSKPSGSERHLDRVSRAEAGAVLAIKLVFVGVKPDWQGQVDVNYDLSITAPDGKTYGEQYTALSGVKGRVERETGVFDNRNKIVLMQFEDSDLPGIYTIKVVLHDRVSGLDLPLQAQVELIETTPVIPGITVPEAPPQAAPGTMMPVPDAKAAPPVRTGKRHRRHRH